VLHDQKAVVVLLQYGHELEGGEGSAHVQLGDIPVQPAEDAGVVAADEEDLIALQFRVAVDGSGHQLHRGDQDVEGLGEEGDGRAEFDLHDGGTGCFGDIRARQGGGAKVSIDKINLANGKNTLRLKTNLDTVNNYNWWWINKS